MWMQICILLNTAALLFGVTMAVTLEDLPSGFPSCRRTDPQMEKCLLEATETVRSFMITGVPNFIPSIINFSIPAVILQDGNDVLNYRAQLSNVTLYGLENYKFKRFNFDYRNLTFFIDVDIPNIYLEGTYLVEGKIFFAPIKGRGNFHVKLSNSSCLMLQNVTVIRKTGLDFLKPIKTVPKFKVGNIIDYGFDGLFGNSDEINKIARHVIDDNLSIIVEELLPTIEKVLLSFFENFIFKSVTRIPYDKLYPK